MEMLSLERFRTRWGASPWLHYAAVVAVPMLYFLVIRLHALSALLHMNATPTERTFGYKLGGILLGVMEDFSVTVLMLAILLLVEFMKQLLSSWLRWIVRERHLQRGWRISIPSLQLLGLTVRFVVVFMLVLLTLSLCTFDLLVVRAREIHFTTDIIATYWREKDQGAGTLELEPKEVKMIIHALIGMVITALIFAVGYVSCIDLLMWRSMNLHLEAATTKDQRDEVLDGATYTSITECDPTCQDHCKTSPQQRSQLHRLPSHLRVALVGVATISAYSALIATTSAIARAAHPTITAIALNASLNELFRGVLGIEFTRSVGSGEIKSAAYYLEVGTESFELFRDDVLYRKTTGFKGPLAFNVSIDPSDAPNVLVLAVESFRYQDSLYLAGNTTAGAVMGKHNLTLTSQFDRWAKRGVAFTNMWGSWQTSRSIEAVLFSQVVYDSLPVSGTSRGRVDTKLVGMPQFYKQKGYETVFTTGGNISYDQWDSFLPSHGFETVLGADDMKRIAERNYNISKSDWWGDARRAFIWGVHDDISFSIVGDIMIQKTKEQAERIRSGQAKKPFFFNHYTISSHFPFRASPAWLDKEVLPDFSPLCQHFEDKCELIKRYARLRYFTDMELGKFLDRMDAAGVLNDTIVMIVGDHGQSPEMGLANPVFYETAVQHVAGALLASGRLGDSEGLVISDATHQNDIQSTLADIVGVPMDGFFQTGIGRSLKRQIPFGERLVWSNNPWRRMSIVRGRERFVYDGTSNRIALYDTIDDPLERHDLLPSRSTEEVAAWKSRWQAGREIDMYFKKRWDRKCLAQVQC